MIKTEREGTYADADADADADEGVKFMHIYKIL